MERNGPVKLFWTLVSSMIYLSRLRSNTSHLPETLSAHWPRHCWWWWWGGGAGLWFEDGKWFGCVVGAQGGRGVKSSWISLF